MSTAIIIENQRSANRLGQAARIAVKRGYLSTARAFQQASARYAQEARRLMGLED